MCAVTDDESNAADVTDGLHQVDPAYGFFECITRNCKKCGPSNVLLNILHKNPDIENCKSKVSWDRWEWVPKKKDSKSKCLVIVTHYGMKKKLIDQYIHDLHAMSFHVFSCNWNYSQFLHIKEHLKPGQLLQVLDFGQNYMNVCQDQPQGVHWDHSQIVIHPIVNYYLGTDGSLVTEEHIMISDDLKHNKYAVHAFEKATLNHLKEKGFVPTQIIQFCDNCTEQYKSKGPFQFIYESGIPTVHMFFGARHGKGSADGVVGRMKSAAKRAVKA